MDVDDTSQRKRILVHYPYLEEGYFCEQIAINPTTEKAEILQNAGMGGMDVYWRCKSGDVIPGSTIFAYVHDGDEVYVMEELFFIS